MFCEKCGKEISENAVFCKNCGASVNDDNYASNDNYSAYKNEVPKKETKKKKKPLVLAIVLVAVAIVLIVCIGIVSAAGIIFLNSPWAKEKKQLIEAQKYVSASDYDNAIKSYEALVQMDNQNDEYYRELAQLYDQKAEDLMKNGKEEKAGKYYDKELKLLEDAYDKTKNEEFNSLKEELAQKLKGDDETTQTASAEETSDKPDDGSNDNVDEKPVEEVVQEEITDEKLDIQLLDTIRASIAIVILDPEANAGGGYYEGREMSIDKVLYGKADDAFFEIMGVSSYDELRDKLRTPEARAIGQIYVDVIDGDVRAYCGNLSAGIEHPANTDLSSGTYGDWAITEAPVGFFWGGTWVSASQSAVDAGKADGIKEILEYITLDDSENGMQYSWASYSAYSDRFADCENIYPSNGGSKGTIEVWSYTDEVPLIIYQYIKDHPDFDYNIHSTIIGTGAGYQESLKNALKNKKADIYVTELSFIYDFTKGDSAKYAAPYSALGIDVKQKCSEADIAQYVIDIGTRPSDGEIVGLGYQSTCGAFIYRRSIAREVWGTDDPVMIKEIIGGGTGTWNKYWDAAEDLKQNGYAICSGDNDMWQAVKDSAAYGWVVDGKLYIDPKRDEFMDISKKMYDNNYSNDTLSWTDAWFYAMKGEGDKEVFGYFGPAWLVNYSLRDNCGNRPNTDPEGDTVCSTSIMKEIPCISGFLGGQDMFEVYGNVNQKISGNTISAYDDTINMLWLDEVAEYKYGNKSKEEAIADFKDDVSYYLGISAY